MGVDIAGSRDERPNSSGCLCRVLALTTALACLAALLGPWIAKNRQHNSDIERFVEAAKRRGGNLYVTPGDVNIWDGTVNYNAEFDRRAIDDDFLADLCWMPGFRSVITIRLSHTPITDAGVAVLRRNSHLVIVDTGRIAITDRSVETLLTIPKLQSLQLSGTKVTDACLEYLKKPRPGLPLLGADVTDTAVTEAAVRKFSETSEVTIIYGTSKAPKSTRW